MEAWQAFLMGVQASTPTASGDTTAKTRRVDGADDVAREMASLGLKLSLKNAKYSRTLLGATFSVYRLDATGYIFAAMKTITDAFEKEVAGKKGHGILPDARRFSGALIACIAHVNPEEKAIIEQFLTDHPPDTPQLNRAIKTCLTERMHNKDYKRLYINVAAGYETVTAILHKCILADKGVELHGRAPKGDLERRAQESLERHGFSSQAAAD